MGEENNAAAAPESPPAHPQQNPPLNNGSRRRKWFWIATLAVLLTIAFFLVQHFRAEAKVKQTKAAEQKADVGASITVGQAKTGNINIYIDTLGTVTPTYTVTVYSQITGRVLAVHYTEGQLVQAGDPLIDIDPAPYQATLTQAQGTLERDQGALAEARIDLKRYQAALAKNAIAKQQVDDQEQVVVQDEGTVKSDQGTVAYDQVQLAYCHIVAPITGRVGLRLVDPGNTIFSGSGSTLVVITQMQPITVVFNVSEDDIPKVQAQLRNGHTLEVDAFDRSNDREIEAGKLISLDNQVDTTTGTLKFRATFPNKTLSLFPNQFVNARLLLRTLRNTTLIPTAAVQHNGTAAFVYVVQPNNTVSVQNVTALTGNDQVTAVQGLNSGASVATSGFDRLENGVRVSVPGENPPANATNGAAQSSGKSPPANQPAK